jgi:hypothetical protein
VTLALTNNTSSTTTDVLCLDPTSGDLFVFAATTLEGVPAGWKANHIYYTRYDASRGAWSPWTDWIDESAEGLARADTLSCFYQTYGGYVGLVYMTKTVSPYNVKFAYLRAVQPRVEEAGGSGGAVQPQPTQISGLPSPEELQKAVERIQGAGLITIAVVVAGFFLYGEYRERPSTRRLSSKWKNKRRVKNPKWKKRKAWEWT